MTVAGTDGTVAGGSRLYSWLYYYTTVMLDERRAVTDYRYAYRYSRCSCQPSHNTSHNTRLSFTRPDPNPQQPLTITHQSSCGVCVAAACARWLLNANRPSVRHEFDRQSTHQIQRENKSKQNDAFLAAAAAAAVTHSPLHYHDDGAAAAPIPTVLYILHLYCTKATTDTSIRPRRLTAHA